MRLLIIILTFLFFGGELTAQQPVARNRTPRAFIVPVSPAGRPTFKEMMAKVEGLQSSGKVRELEQLFLSATDSTRGEIARNISRYYNDARYEPKNVKKAIEYATISLEISEGMNDRDRQINSHNQLGYIYSMASRHGEAEIHFLRSIELGKQLKSDNVGFAYLFMLDLTDRMGHFNRAIGYGLDALRYLNRPGYDENAMLIHYILGRLYGSLGDYDNSLLYMNRALKQAEQRADMKSYWYYMNGIASVMLRLGRQEQALKLIESELIRNPPVSLEYPSLMLGKVYTALRRFDNARKYLLQAMSIKSDEVLMPAICKALADLYFATGDYELSKEYVDKVFGYKWPAASMTSAHFLAFQIDSARGQYQSALYHLQKHKALNDSINASSRVRQIEELKVQYQTENLMQDALLNHQKILLLQKQQELQSRQFEESRLNFLLEDRNNQNHVLTLNNIAAEKDKNLLKNEQNITRLQLENASRTDRLENATKFRNVSIGFLLLFFLIIVLMYRQYRSKQASAKIIRRKNKELEEIVGEKEKLLEEKEWLLREVHHRVKNNLQTVVSLLESQSVFLDSKALEANQDSRNRVYAMSLVHQKLYQSADVASIQMDTYLGELIQYLRDSMDVSGVRFHISIVPVSLDVSQAICVGLIVNEAITNSVKHAVHNRTGERAIRVTLERMAGDHLVLMVTDNGSGVRDSVANGPSVTLGLKLMKGLTGDIMGDISIYSNDGTVVKVSFVPQDTFSRHLS